MEKISLKQTKKIICKREFLLTNQWKIGHNKTKKNLKYALRLYLRNGVKENKKNAITVTFQA